jgi:protein TonB
MLLHGLLVVLIPQIKFDDIKIPEVLQVELAKKPEVPPPVVEPLPPPPEIVKPKVTPKITPKPLPKPTPVIKTPEPLLEPVHEVAPPEPVQEVIAVSSEVKNPEPTHIVPIAEPIKEAPPVPRISQADMDDARGKYSSSLWGAISKHKRYPKIAQMRGWQGEAIIELQLDGNGKLKSKKISQSSGYEALDKQALEMVEKALPFPTPPEVLRGSPFTISVPVPFKLE